MFVNVSILCSGVRTTLTGGLRRQSGPQKYDKKGATQGASASYNPASDMVGVTKADEDDVPSSEKKVRGPHFQGESGKAERQRSRD